MVYRYNLFLSLPVYLRELLNLMVNHFQVILERHDKSITFETQPDSLLAIKLTSFRARLNDEQNMKTFTFNLIPPFNDYLVKIDGLEYRPENKEIFYKFTTDIEFTMAIQQGLSDSVNQIGDLERFEERQLLMTLTKWPGNHVLTQLNNLTGRMTMAEYYNHTDILAVAANAPFSSPLNTFKLVLDNDVLVFLHQQQVMRRHAELMSKRRTGRQVVHIPANTAAAVAPVPGTVQERTDELARLHDQLNTISARIQQINPAAPNPVQQPDGPAGGDANLQNQGGGGAGVERVGGGGGDALADQRDQRMANYVHNVVNPVVAE